MMDSVLDRNIQSYVQLGYMPECVVANTMKDVCQIIDDWKCPKSYDTVLSLAILQKEMERNLRLILSMRDRQESLYASMLVSRAVSTPVSIHPSIPSSISTTTTTTTTTNTNTSIVPVLARAVKRSSPAKSISYPHKEKRRL